MGGERTRAKIHSKTQRISDKNVIHGRKKSTGSPFSTKTKKSGIGKRDGLITGLKRRAGSRKNEGGLRRKLRRVQQGEEGAEGERGGKRGRKKRNWRNT